MRRLDNWPDQPEDGESIEAYILKGLRKLDVEVAKMVADSVLRAVLSDDEGCRRRWFL